MPPPARPRRTTGWQLALDSTAAAAIGQMATRKGPEKKDRVHECVVAKMQGGAGVASLLNGINDLLEAGRLADAEAAARRAIAKATEVAGPSSLPVAKGYMLLAKTYQTMAHHAEAEKAARYALSTLEAIAGPDAPPTYSSRIILGAALTSLSRYREAETYLNRALLTSERSGAVVPTSGR